jgi:hypothetical protein
MRFNSRGLTPGSTYKLLNMATSLSDERHKFIVLAEIREK